MNDENQTRFDYQEAFITLATIDLDRSLHFYRRLLQQDPDPYIPAVYAEFNLLGVRLGIFCPKESHRGEFGDSKGCGMSICWEVVDLDEAIEHLRAIGYPATAGMIEASHGRELYVYDPDGHRLILHQSIAKTRPLR